LTATVVSADANVILSMWHSQSHWLCMSLCCVDFPVQRPHLSHKKWKRISSYWRLLP